MQYLEKSRENKQRNRELDKTLGEQYRLDPRAIGMTFTDYKREWQESIKLKEMKTHYSAYEPLPNESPYDFKKRLKSITLEVPIETKKEFIDRVGTAFK